MAQDAKIDRLATIPLFTGLRRRELDKIARLCTEIRIPAGRVLCREGEIGHEFFVLEQGAAEVTVGGTPVATVGPGDFFGELALLDAGPRNATVTAKDEVSVLVLSQQEFQALLEEEPIVAVRMLPAIGQRLRNRVRSAQEQPPVV